jgi:BON domain
MRRAAVLIAVAGVALSPALLAQDATELKNWFDDPFFATSSAIPGCPAPLGPLMTRTEMERQAHVRVERGLRCYQEGKCRKASSYQYDAEIAENLRAALANSPALKGTSVWVTVQRRWIYLQGCVDSLAKKRTLEQIARGIPDVMDVFVDVTTDASKSLPYPPLDPSQRR